MSNNVPLDRVLAAVRASTDRPIPLPRRSLEEAPMSTAAKLVTLSRWVNDGNAHASADALLWIRLSKPAEEAGEVIAALNAATGANPRKPAVEGLDDVVEELLDTAVAALAAVEHVTGHAGLSLLRLADKVDRVHTRALAAPDRARRNHENGEQ